MKAIQILFTCALMISTLSACQAGPRMPLAASAPMVQSPLLRSMSQARSARVVFHVLPDSKFGGWLVKQEKQAMPVSSHRSKEEAVAAGRAMARQQVLGQLIIHKANGQIETEHTYGQDPAGTIG